MLLLSLLLLSPASHESYATRILAVNRIADRGGDGSIRADCLSGRGTPARWTTAVPASPLHG